jgi:hypothetical protein
MMLVDERAKQGAEMRNQPMRREGSLNHELAPQPC